MNSTVLRKDFSLFFAFGGDVEPKDPPRVTVPEEKPSVLDRLPKPDDDDDDDDDHIDDPKDRKIAKLSKENKLRRITNKNLDSRVSQLEEENASLRKELGKAEKLQTSYDELKTKRNEEQTALRRMAIRSAIEKDSIENDQGEATPRAWYDVSMVQSLLDKDQISVDLNDFSVGGLREQLDKIAEERPFLVKPNDSGSSNQNQRTPSGSAPQSSATGTPRQQQNADENALLAEFPAMQGLIK